MGRRHQGQGGRVLLHSQHRFAVDGDWRQRTSGAPAWKRYAARFMRSTTTARRRRWLPSRRPDCRFASRSSLREKPGRRLSRAAHTLPLMSARAQWLCDWLASDLSNDVSGDLVRHGRRRDFACRSMICLELFFFAKPRKRGNDAEIIRCAARGKKSRFCQNCTRALPYLSCAPTIIRRNDSSSLQHCLSARSTARPRTLAPQPPGPGRRIEPN